MKRFGFVYQVGSFFNLSFLWIEEFFSLDPPTLRVVGCWFRETAVPCRNVISSVTLVSTYMLSTDALEKISLFKFLKKTTSSKKPLKKKHVTLWRWSNIASWVFFLCLSGISFGQFCWKNLVKSGGFRKKIKKGNGQKEGLSIERGFQTFCTLWSIFYSISQTFLWY